MQDLPSRMDAGLGRPPRPRRRAADAMPCNLMIPLLRANLAKEEAMACRARGDGAK